MEKKEESVTNTRMKTALRNSLHQRPWYSNVDLLFPPEKMSMKNDQQMVLAKRVRVCIL